jgi:hypothetical protein
MTCLSIGVDLQEEQEKETLATSNGMSDEHGNEPSGNWDNLRNWGLTKCGCKLHAAGTGKRSSGQQQLLGFADWLVHPMHSKACFHLLQLLFYLSAVFFWGPSPQFNQQKLFKNLLIESRSFHFIIPGIGLKEIQNHQPNLANDP